ncbi:MAG: competence/damage-inducible protein A [Gammaproteobacteria bacterium WSBS_2016_MAG_OTU1]
MEKILTIGLLIIGDEILSGRTVEKNLPMLAIMLADKGLRIDEARVVRDVPATIANAVCQMREQYDYVFTSGGIGPTHDDVTAVGVAQGFSVEVEENAAAVEVLAAFYDTRGLEFTAARRLMARAPVGAGILRSEFPGAPGFVMKNVFICAGVPEIFRLMATAALSTIPNFPKRIYVTLRADGAESELAFALADVQQKWEQLEIGSYPRRENGHYYCHLVFSGMDENAIDEATTAMADFLQQKNIPCQRVEFNISAK